MVKPDDDITVGCSCGHDPLNSVSPPALLKLLDLVLPCFVESLRTDRERQVAMSVLETMNNVMRSCKEEVCRNPAHLKEISHVIQDVLKKKVRDGRGQTACKDVRTAH